MNTLQTFGNAPRAVVAPTASPALGSAVVVSTKPCALYGCSINVGTSALYLLILDAAVAPSSGDAVLPVACYGPLTISLPFAVDFPTPFLMKQGVVLVASTTGPFTYTAPNTGVFMVGQAL